MNVFNELSEEVDHYLKKLFPISRSLTGNGNRSSLSLLQEIVPLVIHDYPCGSKVYDWVIPDEWLIYDAWIKDESGNRLVDWNLCNLHVVNYSVPVHALFTYDELVPKLYHLENYPEAIPYRTAYYEKDWGFCVTGTQLESLRHAKGKPEVCIDSKFAPDGTMTIGDIVIPGLRKEEFLVSTYICHPSMANDNLSGLITTALLARHLLELGSPEHSWRFVFVPETIGAIAYLKFNPDMVENTRGGFVVSCCGGTGSLGYKETFLGNHLVDRAVRLAFRDHNVTPIRYPFVPDGSDERQYSSPGFRIPVATITKDKYYEFPQYHTSMDNLDFVNGRQIVESLQIYQTAIEILDGNRKYKSTQPCGEIQLSSRGLYPTIGGSVNQRLGVVESQADQKAQLDVILWLLFLADGSNDYVDIAEQTGYKFSLIKNIANLLETHGLLLS